MTTEDLILTSSLCLLRVISTIDLLAIHNSIFISFGDRFVLQNERKIEKNVNRCMIITGESFEHKLSNS